jgi:hypothetical protein
MNLAQWLGQFIGEAIRPIIMDCMREVIHELTTNTAVVSKPNADLQQQWIDGLPTGDPDPKGRSLPNQPYS